MPYRSKEKRLQWHAEWEKRNRDHRNAYQRERRKKNREAITAKERERIAKNPEKAARQYIKHDLKRKALILQLPQEAVDEICNNTELIESILRQRIIKRIQRQCKTLQTLEKPSSTPLKN